MKHIGLPEEAAIEIAQGLNEVLANMQVQYQNARASHWNIKGPQFFDLHPKFETLYNDLQLQIDEVAERILTLGIAPLHTFQDYMRYSEIEVLNKVSNAAACVQGLLAGYEIILIKLRAVLALSGEAGDEGSSSLMSDLVSNYEKEIWMLKAYLG